MFNHLTIGAAGRVRPISGADAGEPLPSYVRSFATERMDEPEKTELNQVGEADSKDVEGDFSKQDIEKTVQESALSDGIEAHDVNDVKEELSCEEKEILPQCSTVDAEEAKGDLQRDQPALLEKKAKANPKPNLRGKYTIPQPFSLTTEKRRPREKNGSGQVNSSLSKSISLRTNSQILRTVQTQTSLRLERTTEATERKHGTTNSRSSMQRVLHTQTLLRVDRSVELRRGNSKSASKDKEHSEKQTKPLNQKDKEQEKEVNIKKPRSNSKVKQVEDIMDTNKMKKVSTFKASPLPGFYHKRSASLKPDLVEKEEELKMNKLQVSSSFKASPLPSFYSNKAPPKPEVIKIPLTQPKPPNLGTRNKSASESGITSKAASRTITNTAKETIKNLLRGPWKTPDRKGKEVKDSKASCRTEMNKGMAASSVEGKDVAVSN